MRDFLLLISTTLLLRGISAGDTVGRRCRELEYYGRAKAEVIQDFEASFDICRVLTKIEKSRKSLRDDFLGYPRGYGRSDQYRKNLLYFLRLKLGLFERFHPLPSIRKTTGEMPDPRALILRSANQEKPQKCSLNAALRVMRDRELAGLHTGEPLR
jgi:hypothetical protein